MDDEMSHDEALSVRAQTIMSSLQDGTGQWRNHLDKSFAGSLVAKQCDTGGLTASDLAISMVKARNDQDALEALDVLLSSVDSQDDLETIFILDGAKSVMQRWVEYAAMGEGSAERVKMMLEKVRQSNVDFNRTRMSLDDAFEDKWRSVLGQLIVVSQGQTRQNFEVTKSCVSLFCESGAIFNSEACRAVVSLADTKVVMEWMEWAIEAHHACTEDFEDAACVCTCNYADVNQNTMELLASFKGRDELREILDTRQSRSTFTLKEP